MQDALLSFQIKLRRSSSAMLDEKCWALGSLANTKGTDMSHNYVACINVICQIHYLYLITVIMLQ